MDTNTLHTPGRITFREDGDANHYSMLTEDGRWLLALLHNGEAPSARQVENMRRLAACWNACDGIPTDTLEAGADGLVRENADLWRVVLPIHDACEANHLTDEKGGVDFAAVVAMIEAKRDESQHDGSASHGASDVSVWVLSWDVRNANEPTGSQVFASEALAIDQVIAWLDGDFGDLADEAAVRAALQEDGYVQIESDRFYSITGEAPRTAIRKD